MLHLYTIGSEEKPISRPLAIVGKQFEAQKVRTFDRSKLDAIFKMSPKVVELEQWCETVAVVTTIFRLTAAVENILEVRFRM